MDRSQLELSTDQLRVMLEPTRTAILDLLNDGPASVKQLARALKRPPSTIAHHCSTLLDAGLVIVEHTRRVRAIDERYFARSARTFLLGPAMKQGVGRHHSPLREAADEADRSQTNREGFAGLPSMSTFRVRRIPDAAAAEFADRLTALAEEFVEVGPGGSVRYGITLAIFPTTRPAIDEDGA